MEFLSEHKWALLGGVAVLAVAAYWFASNSAASSDSGGTTPDYYTAGALPLTSGTGTPVDQFNGGAGNDTSSLAAVLAQLATANAGSANDNTAASIALQGHLGELAISSNEAIAQYQAETAQTASLSDFASTLSNNITKGRFSAQSISVTDAQGDTFGGSAFNVFTNPKQNVPLISMTSTRNNGKATVPIGLITLPTGQTLQTDRISRG